MQKVNQTYKIAPADRQASVSEYYFTKKLKKVAQMNAEGKDVISRRLPAPRSCSYVPGYADARWFPGLCCT